MWLPKIRLSAGLLSTAFGAILIAAPAPAEAQLVPGTGKKITTVGDDFEDEAWEYYLNLPKASSNIDRQQRLPAGGSANSRVYESTYRGQPDIIRRVPTPAGGLPESTGALLLRSRETGIPGRITNDMQQDDLLMNVGGILGGFIPVTWSPSFVVRVYLPPFEEWERRTGASLGIRADVQAYTSNSVGRNGFFSRARMVRQLEAYWPGMFIQFNCKGDGVNQEDSAVLIIRGDDYGHDYNGPVIKETGWWTFGMSFTPDGRMHYYASPGVDDLTPEDRIGSSMCYGEKCDRFQTLFFNVVTQDNGRNWSTPWIIDDPCVYWNRPE